MFNRITTAFIAGTLCSGLLTVPAMADPKHCPPGHEKKGWCEFGERNEVRGDRGGEMRDEAETEVVILQNLDDYTLPPLPAGERYAVIDNRIVRVDADTYATIAVVGALADLLN